jgi:glutathione-regulated potassium-efflux system ancillary protein KefG
MEAVADAPSVTVRDLYELYPDFNVDIAQEKELLVQHDVIVWQHPLYWYSAPPLLKQWIDMVLEFGWAYGPSGTALRDKWVFNVISSGGAEEAYQLGGKNRYPIQEYLRPFEQTARLCGMHFLPPFAVHGTHKLGDEELAELGTRYGALMNGLAQGAFALSELQQLTYLHELNSSKSSDV